MFISNNDFFILLIFVLSLVKLSFNVVCPDTPSWDDGYGYGCSQYAGDWCKNGGPVPGGLRIGANYNYPEKNCCVCGKGNFRNNLPNLNYDF